MHDKVVFVSSRQFFLKSGITHICNNFNTMSHGAFGVFFLYVCIHAIRCLHVFSNKVYLYIAKNAYESLLARFKLKSFRIKIYVFI